MQMMPTHIRKGDLVIDMHGDGTVQIVRQSTMQGIVLSISEWEYLQKVADLHGWPIVKPNNVIPEVRT